MPSRALAHPPRTFDELVRQVRDALINGQLNADRIYLESYHYTGRLIDVHLLLNQKRAAYGAQVVPHLSRVVGVSDRLLYRCLQFAREYAILPHGAELGWTHYRLLLEVSDKTQRKTLESDARRHHWTAPELERRVREANAIDVTPVAGAGRSAASTMPKPLVPQRGTPGLHLIVERGPSTSLRAGGGLAVDLGFRLYWPLTPDQAKRLAKGDIVRIAGDDSLRRVDDATKAGLFTYAAGLRRVIDGDTLVVALEVSPGVFLEQKLRLRGLDCPELSTPEGKAAKRFVDELVAKSAGVVINTTKPDKYDRYLADVFLIGTTDQSAEGPTKADIFLNHALLEHGHAVRKEAWEFGDWEPGLRR